MAGPRALWGDRIGTVLIVGGIACVIAATGLGFYLASVARETIRTGDSEVYERLGEEGYASFQSRASQIQAGRGLLAGVQILMWASFGFGVILTLAGIRAEVSRSRFAPVPDAGRLLSWTDHESHTDA